MIIARFKQYGTWAIYLLPLLLLGFVYFIFRIFKKPDVQIAESTKLNNALSEISDLLTEANNKAVLKIAVAKTTEKLERAELQAVVLDRDKKRRRRNLIALRERIGK